MLRLVPLAGLAATAAGDREACHRLIGARLPEDWFEEDWVHEQRFNQWKADPGFAPWSIRALILRDTGDIIGNINCHGNPLPFIHGGQSGMMVEMGYSVFGPWRRRGFATEAIRGLSDFAQRHGVRWVRLSISPTNEASLQLAQKLGAAKIGSQLNDTDGPEDVYLFRL